MKRLIAAAALTIIVTAGCSSSVDNAPDVGPTDPTTGNLAPPSAATLSPNRALFAPNQGILPYPHDAYFTPTPGVASDGTLNVPSSAFFPATVRLPSGVTEPVVNALDGFSTVASSTVRFSAPIDPATISGDTVKMIRVRVNNANKAPVIPDPSDPNFDPDTLPVPLVYGTDYTARVSNTIDSAGSTLEIVPLKPLEASTGDITVAGVGYIVVLTNGLADTSGNVATPDSDYLAIRSAVPACTAVAANLQGICLLTAAQLGLAALPARLADRLEDRRADEDRQEHDHPNGAHGGLRGHRRPAVFHGSLRHAGDKPEHHRHYTIEYGFHRSLLNGYGLDTVARIVATDISVLHATSGAILEALAYDTLTPARSAATVSAPAGLRARLMTVACAARRIQPSLWT